MSDPVLELRESDPAAHARTAPPRDVLERIVATPLQAPRPPRRRVPRIALGAAALAAAAVVAFAALPGGDNAPGPIRASLAERAFAATAPQPDFITYTETTTVQTGNPRTESYDKLRQWQYGDRMHNFMETRQPRGEWVYEHDQNGATIRTLMRNDKGGKEVQVTHKTDPGWDREELESGFKAGVTTLVERVPRSDPRRARTWGRPRSTASAPTRTVPSGARNACRPATPSTTSIPRRRSRSAARRRSPPTSRRCDDGKPVQGEPTGTDHDHDDRRPLRAPRADAREPEAPRRAEHRRGPAETLDGEGAGGDPGLAAVDLLGGDFLPSAFQQGGMMVRMANGKGADEHAFRLLAQDRVPQGARVPVPAYGMPGPRRQVDPVRHAELHEPAQGGDLTR